MGIIKAYQDGNADRYREYLIEHATEFGIRPEKVESMTAPVLVRRRLTKVDRVQFARTQIFLISRKWQPVKRLLLMPTA